MVPADGLLVCGLPRLDVIGCKKPLPLGHLRKCAIAHPHETLFAPTCPKALLDFDRTRSVPEVVVGKNCPRAVSWERQPSMSPALTSERGHPTLVIPDWEMVKPRPDGTVQVTPLVSDRQLNGPCRAVWP
jgi:hypothetical protein